MQTENEGIIDCGNGKRSDSCLECGSNVKNGSNPDEWCGGDCKWDDFFDTCELASTDGDDNWF